MYIQQWERWLQRRFLATGKWVKGPFLVRLSATDFKIYVSWTKTIFWTFLHLQFFGYLNSIGQAFVTHVNNLSPWGLRGMKWSSSFKYQNLLVCVQAVLAWLVGRLERPEKLDRPWNQFERCSETTTRYTRPRLLFVLLITVKSQKLQGMDLSWCFRVTSTSNEKWLVEDMAAACSALATCPGPGGIVNLTSVQGLKVTISFFSSWGL